MLVDRMLRAARLEPALYNEVEADRNATAEALTVVVLVALAGGIGTAIGTLFRGHPAAALGGLIFGIAAALIGWIIWSYVTYLVGTTMFGGTATPGQMLRCIGFAQSPRVLDILGFIPCFGGLIRLVVAIWALVAGIIAVREALDFSTGQAILTAIIGFIAMIIIYAIIALIVTIFGIGLSALF